MRLGVVTLTLASACSVMSHTQSASSRSAQNPAAIPVRWCGTAVGGSLPPGWRQSAVVLPSLALYTFGAMTDDGHRARRGWRPPHMVKIPALVQPGSAVTLTVPAAQRRFVSLAWIPSQQSGLPSLQLSACAPSEADHGITGWTQFNGGVNVTGRRCVTLEATAGRTRWRITLAVGVPGCPG